MMTLNGKTLDLDMAICVDPDNADNTTLDIWQGEDDVILSVHIEPDQYAALVKAGIIEV